MKLFVDAKSSKQGDGSRENPFKCINDAAKVAAPGDEILVMPGIYRENVCPVRAGLPDAPIVYKSVEPLLQAQSRQRIGNCIRILCGA